MYCKLLKHGNYKPHWLRHFKIIFLRVEQKVVFIADVILNFALQTFHSAVEKPNKLAFILTVISTFSTEY